MLTKTIMTYKIRSQLLLATHDASRCASHGNFYVFRYLTKKRILAFSVLVSLMILTALVPFFLFSSLNQDGNTSKTHRSSKLSHARERSTRNISSFDYGQHDLTSNIVNDTNQFLKKSPILQNSNQDKFTAHSDYKSSEFNKKSYYHYVTNNLNDLKQRIKDLENIKISVINELRYLEKEKLKLNQDKIELQTENAELTTKLVNIKSNLKQLELDLSKTQLTKYENKCDNLPALFMPIKVSDLKSNGLQDRKLNNQLQTISKRNFRECFNFGSCPLATGFKVYFYDLFEQSIKNKNIIDDDANTTNAFHHGRYDDGVLHPYTISENIIYLNRYRTMNPTGACLFVLILDGRNEKTYKNLSLWNNGYNHLIIDLSDKDSTPRITSSCAIIAKSTFTTDSYRETLDLVIPSTWIDHHEYENIIGALPRQCPARRQYLASYFGLVTRKGQSPEDDLANSIPLNQTEYLFPEHSQLNELEEVLRSIRMDSTTDQFLFRYYCGPNTNKQCFQDKDKWMGRSTFLIILPHSDLNILASSYQSHLLYLSLSRSTIPVIVGSEFTKLPFDEVIDWCRAAICLPTARLSELHFILKTLPDSDLIRLKQQGRHIFVNYMATSKQVLDTILMIIGISRLKYPSFPVIDIDTQLYDIIQSKDATISNTTAFSDQLKDQPQEILGPVEMPQSSLKFYRNFSLVLTQSYDLWNDARYIVNHLYPSTPFDPTLPSDAKFMNSAYGFRPIANGAGGSGLEFSQSLGGDWPREQFTIVLLTYEREPVMLKTLSRFKGLPYLNSVLVVWNSKRHKPSPNLTWPDIGVPIKVVKTKRNSLNNRFLPYDEIETDAILSIDDDSPLKQDEIIFGFRVWRESRDRIVGFPGRYHAWNQLSSTWQYNSNHSCELSMVLTGGAFYHKYYSYLYTYTMPSAIRVLVDKYTNCEDIAMNFLVSHITRKPPIKVTSRWTFHCPGCPVSLSEDDSHFRERHDCINTFISIYGYMPLMSTQHRADSILFKTRIPRDKQKCFKNV